MRSSSWNPDLYTSKHGFVSRYGLEVVELLQPEVGERILDLGCGTGVLTSEIAKAGAQVLGLDHSAEMIAKAKADFPHLEFVVEDGENFQFSEKFNAVFSNAALHWMMKPEKVIARIWDSLEPGGRFVAEFGGQGNIETLLDAIAKALMEKKTSHSLLDAKNLVNYFPSLAEYTTLLEAQGFRITHAFHFDRPTPLEGQEGLRNWIQMFRGFVLKDLSPEEQESFLSLVEQKARPSLYKNAQWFADYKRLRVRAVKPTR